MKPRKQLANPRMKPLMMRCFHIYGKEYAVSNVWSLIRERTRDGVYTSFDAITVLHDELCERIR